MSTHDEQPQAAHPRYRAAETGPCDEPIRTPEEILTVTRTRVLLASEQCPDARRVLRSLFPEAFAPPPPQEVAFDPKIRIRDLTTNNYIIETRAVGPYHDRGLWLSGVYDWTIEHDTEALVLVARTKGAKS